MVIKRYSEILSFHKQLEIELNMKKKFGDNLPEFPPKTLFNNTDKHFIHQRVKSLNLYFKQLFKVLPDRLPYTLSINDLCQP